MPTQSGSGLVTLWIVRLVILDVIVVFLYSLLELLFCQTCVSNKCPVDHTLNRAVGREEGAGHYLQAGDRIIELNGENVVRILGSVWQTMMDKLTFPVKVVVMREVKDHHNYQAAHVAGLKDDVALIQSRLSEKLLEGRHVSLELSSVQQQRDKLVSDNTRLRHRIQYLEDQVSHLEGGMKQVLVVLEIKNLWISRTFHRISGQRFSCEDS